MDGRTMEWLFWQDTKRHFICPVAEGRNPSCSSWRLPSIASVSFPTAFHRRSPLLQEQLFHLLFDAEGDRSRRFIPPFTARDSLPASHLHRNILPASFHLLQLYIACIVMEARGCTLVSRALKKYAIEENRGTRRITRVYTRVRVCVCTCCVPVKRLLMEPWQAASRNRDFNRSRCRRSFRASCL